MWVRDPGKVRPAGLQCSAQPMRQYTRLYSLHRLQYTTLVVLVIILDKTGFAQGAGWRGSSGAGGGGGGGVAMNTSYSCQGDTLSLACPNNLVIKVMRANYGRFSLTVCNPAGVTDWSVNCMARRSLRIVQDRCDGTSRCEMGVDHQLFGEPCPDTPKYLEVYFGCYHQAATTTTSTTSNPLPPWLTTRSSSLPFIPGLLDLGITPFAASAETVTSSSVARSTATTTTTTTSTTNTTIATSSLTTTSPFWTTNPQPETGLTHASLIEETNNSKTSKQQQQQQPRQASTLSPLSALNSRQEEEEGKLVYQLAESDNTPGVNVILSTLPPPPASQSTPSTRHPNHHLVDTTAPGSPLHPDPYTSKAGGKGEQQEEMRVGGKLITRPPPSSPLPAGLSTAAADELPPLQIPSGPKCPPRRIRSLTWPWTAAGHGAEVACPPGAAGRAHWRCGLNTAGQPVWTGHAPDLSQCQSAWMAKVILELRGSDSIVTISRDLVDYVAANPLYGGDVMAAVNAVTIITEKLEYQLRSIPTLEQQEAMAMEVAQSILKVSSSLLERGSVPAWHDLPSRLRLRFVTRLLETLETFSLVLPRTISSPDREVSVSSNNLLLVVKKASFRNIRGSSVPSAAARATRNWAAYADQASVPALVLMENMGAAGSSLAFLAAANLDLLLAPDHAGEVVNSQVLHLSLGEPHPTVREPVRILFTHLARTNATTTVEARPRCAAWDRATNLWSSEKCVLEATNATHSTCACSVLGTLALLETAAAGGAGDPMDRVTLVVTLVVAVTVAVISTVSLALLVYYCKRVKVRDEWKFRLAHSGLPCFIKKRETDYPTNNSNVYSSGPTLYSPGSPPPTAGGGMYSSAAATQFGLYDAGTAGGGTGGGICTATGGFYAASTGEDGGGGFYAAGGTPTFFTSSQNIFPNADFLMLSAEAARSQQAGHNRPMQLAGGHNIRPAQPVGPVMQLARLHQPASEDAAMYHHQPTVASNQPNMYHQPTSNQPGQLQLHVGQLYTSFNGDLLGHGVAGPQAAASVKPQPHTFVSQESFGGFGRSLARMTDKGDQGEVTDTAAHHIYMEVDPLYNTGFQLPATAAAGIPHSSTQVELLASSPSEEEELAHHRASSNSSQSSSGYSTAPSSECYAMQQHQRLPAAVAGSMSPLSNKAPHNSESSHHHTSFAKERSRMSPPQAIFSISSAAVAADSGYTQQQRRNLRGRGQSMNISQEHPLLFQEDTQVM